MPTLRPLLLFFFLCLALLDAGIPTWIRSASQGKQERNHFDSGRYIDGVENKRASRRPLEVCTAEIRGKYGERT